MLQHHAGIPTSKFKTDDIRYCKDVDNLMVVLAKEIEERVNFLITQGAHKIQLTYLNVPDLHENPMGTIGHILVQGERSR